MNNSVHLHTQVRSHLTTKEDLFSTSNELLMHAFIESGLRAGKKVVIAADKDIREWMEASKLLSFILPEVTLRAMPDNRVRANNFGRGVCGLHLLAVTNRPGSLIKEMTRAAAAGFKGNLLAIHTDPM